MDLSKYEKKENYVLGTVTKKGHLYEVLFGENRKYIHGKILFLGGNAGVTLELLHDWPEIVQVWNVDLNKQAINSCRERFINRPKIVSVINNFLDMNEVPNNYFDVVIMFDVFEHVYEEDVPLLFKELRRVCKKDAYVLLFTPRKNNMTGEQSWSFDAHVQFFENTEQLREKIKDFVTINFLYNETRSNPSNETEKHDSLFCRGTIK